MYSETKYILEEYEEYRLAAFRDRYTPEWSDVCGEAERINRWAVIALSCQCALLIASKVISRS